MTLLHLEMTTAGIHVRVEQGQATQGQATQGQATQGQPAQALDREALREQIRQTVDQAVRGARDARTDANAAREGIITIQRPPVPPGTPTQPAGETRVIVNGGNLPQDVKDITAWFFITIAAILILRPLMNAFGRRLERRSAAPVALPPETAQQIARIEQAVEAMAVEVERISEGQRFAAKLLAEREKLPG